MGKDDDSSSSKMRPGALFAQFVQMNPDLKKPSQKKRGSPAKSEKVVVTGKKLRAMTPSEFLKDLTVLPCDIRESEQRLLEQEGFIFQEVVTHNRILRRVKFPEGWTKLATNKAGCTYLMDREGVWWAELHYRPGNAQFKLIKKPT